MADSENKHILSYKTLFSVLLGLLLLTGLTVFISTIELGSLSVWAALLIAACKAALVLYFFMHLKFEGIFIRSSFVCTIVVLSSFIGLMLCDILFR